MINPNGIRRPGFGRSIQKKADLQPTDRNVAWALSAAPRHVLLLPVIEPFLQVMPFTFAAELLKPTKLPIAELMIKTAA